MKKLLFATALLFAALTACNGGGKYKVAVTFPDDSYNGKSAYLTSYDSGDTIDSAVVADNSVVFVGEVGQSYASRLLVNGERLGFIVEKGNISILWRDGKATGTALNDTQNAIVAEIDSIESAAEEKMKSLPEAEADALSEKVDAEIAQKFHEAYETNKDNGLGAWAFNYYLMYNSFSKAQLDSVISTAPEGYAKLVRVQKAIKAAQQLEITAVGKEFTDFSVKGSDGSEQHLSDYVGKGKVTLVDFWASWCGPCRREIANLKQLYAKYDAQMNFVGVAVWDAPADTHKAINELQIPWPVIIGTHNLTEPTDLYGISGIPHIIIFDADGTILSRGLQGDALVAQVEKVMNKK